MKWIHVSERLPEPSVPMSRNKVLVRLEYDREPYVAFGDCNVYGEWHIEGSPSNFTEYIHYWMPLPEPPVVK